MLGTERPVHRRGHRVRLGLSALAACALLSGAPVLSGAPAWAQTDAQARGADAARQWCSLCHTLTGVETDSERAPTFQEIAARPGRDGAYLRRFLDEDHFPMPTYRLFDHEKDDVAAFIASLAKR